MKKSVDKFIDEKVSEEFLPIVKKFRKLIKNKFPELKEEMRGGTEKYYGVPVYRRKRIVLTLSPTKKGLTFAFTDGKKFRDKYSLLEGEGKKSLNLRIGSAQDYSDDVLSYYITQAIEIDES